MNVITKCDKLQLMNNKNELFVQRREMEILVNNQRGLANNFTVIITPIHIICQTSDSIKVETIKQTRIIRLNKYKLLHIILNLNQQILFTFIFSFRAA